MAEPRVSVLLSVRDGLPHLAEALAGLQQQTWRDFEVMAVDDGSRDGSAALLAETARADARFRVLTHAEPQGLTASLNEARTHARGELLARQDADDLSAPGRLAAQVAAMDADPGLVLVGSAYRRIDAAGREIDVVRTPRSMTAIRWTLLFHNPFCHSSVVIRASALRPGEPLYDPSLAFAQDYECWTRLVARGRATNLPDALVALRLHPRQVSARRRAEQQACARRISARALEPLAPGLGAAEIDRLRAVVQDPTILPTFAEWRRLEAIFARMAAEPGIDAAELRRIRARLRLSFLWRPLRRHLRRSDAPQLARSAQETDGPA